VVFFREERRFGCLLEEAVDGVADALCGFDLFS